MDAAFGTLDSDDGRNILSMIDAFDRGQSVKLEQELFKQKKRLDDAERTLLTKSTKKALDDQRIATDKIAWVLSKLADIRRTELKDDDSVSVRHRHLVALRPA